MGLTPHDASWFGGFLYLLKTFRNIQYLRRSLQFLSQFGGFAGATPMWANSRLREETPFPTTGSELKLGLFCSLQSNRSAKFIPLQAPSFCEAQKEISNPTLRAGTAGTGAADKQYWWLSCGDSLLTWLMGGISYACANLDLRDSIILPKTFSVELLRFVCFFFTYASAFILKVFSTIHKFHCFLILPYFGVVRWPCSGLVIHHIEEGQNPGVYDTQETLLVFLLSIDPHIHWLSTTMSVIPIANYSLQLYHFTIVSLWSFQI